MATVNVIVALTSQKFPPNTPEVGAIRISIEQNGTVVQNKDVPPTEPVQASFDGLAAGDYIATAQSIAADGSALGSPMSSPFTVQPDVDRAVPASISVTLA